MSENSENQIPHEHDIQAGIEVALGKLANASDAEFLELIKNPSPIHEALFSYASKEIQTIGKFRTEEVSIRLRNNNITSSVKLVPPEDIERVMSFWHRNVAFLVSRKPAPEVGITVLSQAIYFFFEAHPFYDGNGRTLRTLVAGICNRCGYSLSPNWTIATRPYDSHFRYALKHFRVSPGLLVGAMREYVEPYTLSGLDDLREFFASQSGCEECAETEDNALKALSCNTMCNLGESEDDASGVIPKEKLSEEQRNQLGVLNASISGLVEQLESGLQAKGVTAYVTGVTFAKSEERSLRAKIRSGTDGCCTCTSGQENEWACPCNMCDIDFDTVPWTY